MLDQPTYAVPQVEHCYNGRQATYAGADYTGYEDVPCAGAHDVEVAARRTFTGAAATASLPPALGDASQKAARSICAAAASEYLGGNWETAFVFVRTGLPSAEQWAGGAPT